MYGSPSVDSNMRYWSGVLCSSSLLAWEIDGKRYALCNELDICELKKNSLFDQVFSRESFKKEGKYLSLREILLPLLEKNSETEVILPWNFPSGLFQEFQKAKDTTWMEQVTFSVSDEDFIPERKFKLQKEKLEIKKACSVISRAFGRVREILSQSTVQPDRCLTYQGSVVTSEFLKREIFDICISCGAFAENTIVACGKDSSEPHHQGSGPILANELIVVDIFPRLLATGYYGDMSRTFIKGTPTQAQQELYEAVLDAQECAIAQLKQGEDFKNIHCRVVDFFKNKGYKTGDNYGFFHNLGHGVGLDIHELPYVGGRSDIIENDVVFTLEPGLYYPEIGGVRIEDVFTMTDGNIEPLSSFDYDWVVE